MHAAKSTAFHFDKQLQQKQKAAQLGKEDAKRDARSTVHVTDMELELDVLLSERRLEAAVALIEQQQHNSRNTAPAHLVEQVVSALTIQLSSTAVSLDETRQVVDLLRRLQMEKHARQIFLQARQSHLEASIRRAEGNPSQWLRAMTQRTFDCIKSSVLDFGACFDSVEGSATLVTWTMAEIVRYGERWGRILRGGGSISKIAGIECAMGEAFLCEGECKLPLQSWVRGALRCELGKSTTASVQKALSSMKGIRDDCYSSPVLVSSLLAADHGSAPFGDQEAATTVPSKERVQLTAWAVHAAKHAHRLAIEHVREFEEDAVGPVLQVLGAYYQLAMEKSRDAHLNDQQILGLFGNCFHLHAFLAPSLERIIGGQRIRQYTQAQMMSFVHFICIVKANAVVHRSWQLSHALYQDIAQTPTAPTRQALKLFEWVSTFQLRLSAQTSPSFAVQVVLPLMLEHVADTIHDCEETLWKHVAGLPLSGALQLVLDVRWIQEGISLLRLSTPKAVLRLEAMSQRCVLEYCAANSIKNPSTVFPPSDWFRTTLKPHLESLQQSIERK